MKATGIVRRIDDLGRVVIPKEIRRTMRIREGDPLEIYTDAEGEVIFKKYSPIGEMANFAEIIVEAMAKECGFGIIITDRDRCIAAAGVNKREVLGRRISAQLEETIDSRRQDVFSSPTPALEGTHLFMVLCSPIVSMGEVSGAVVLLSEGEDKLPGETDRKIASVVSSFLGKQNED